MSAPSQVRGLFATPLLRAERLLPLALVAQLIDELVPAATEANRQSGQLAHSAILSGPDTAAINELKALLLPRIVEFGELLFGEALRWQVKELWLNVLEAGGHQALHNHANSFVSGVVYLSASHPSANTVFVRALGGGYTFENRHAGTRPGPFNSDKWISPDPLPGDLVLFPSHLLHEVPVNRGGRRITLAFNAIPERLDASGYALRFAP